jgi:hypothetical protein
MAYTSVTYTPVNVFAGDTDVVAVSATVAANTAIAALAPVKRHTDFTIVAATALTDVVIGILVPDDDGAGVAATAGAKAVSIYKSGDFWGDALDFSAMSTANSNDKKQQLFDRTGITLRFT